MATVGQLKRILADRTDDEHIAYDLWFAADVEDFVAAEMSHAAALTRTEANAVLDAMHRHRDACIGLNWDTVRAEIANERS